MILADGQTAKWFTPPLRSWFKNWSLQYTSFPVRPRFPDFPIRASFLRALTAPWIAAS